MNTVNQSTSERILAAAEAEFMKHGYSGARTTSIAEAAGVTHAMLHYYYRTKKNLFEKIITEKFRMVGDIMLTSIGDPSLPLFDKLKAAIENHLDFIAAHPDLPRFILSEVFSQPEYIKLISKHMQGLMRPALTSLQDQIDRSAERGECRPVDATMLVLDIVSLNIFSFIAKPLLNPILGELMEDMDRFVNLRKKENVQTIIRKLTP